MTLTRYGIKRVDRDEPLEKNINIVFFPVSTVKNPTPFLQLPKQVSSLT
jgi:hypothetical protein